MTNKNRSAVASAAFVAFSLLVPGATKAQRMTPTAIPRPSAQTIHAQPIASHVVSTHAGAGSRIAPASRSGLHFNSASSSFVSSDGSFVSLQELLNPVPGFGFDYHHLSVINQDLGIKAFIDPVTELRLATAERLLRDSSRFSGAGFYLLDGGGAYSVPVDSAPAEQPAQQPQIIVVQATPPSQETSQRAAEQPAPEEQAPLPDVGQFTLVLQNGARVEAVAFTRMKDRIVYITADGSRRTLAVADLDSAATVRVNEERGTPLQLPL
ncbi:MAG: hypothetical protein WB949_14605 [Candidatus Acidiferrales bacterium]